MASEREPSSRELALKQLRDKKPPSQSKMAVRSEREPGPSSQEKLQMERAREEEAAAIASAASPGEGGMGSPNKELRSLQQSQTPTLSVHQFKALWSSLQVLGSFQCKLRAAPNMQALTQHLRKQNFHVVFAASPSDTETEVSICNIRPGGDDPWFMARFLFSRSVFSAAMKAQNAEEVEGYVKKFALARVLKIDTSSVS